MLEPRTSRSQLEARRASTAPSSATSTTCRPPSAAAPSTGTPRCPRFWRQDFKGLSTTARSPAPTSPTGRSPTTTWRPTTTRSSAARACRATSPGCRPTLRPRRRGRGSSSCRPTRRCTPASCWRRARPRWATPPTRSRWRSTRGPSTAGPRCNSCGFCSGYGCPINARGGAVSFLHHALLAGAELRSRCFVYRVDLAAGNRADRRVATSTTRPATSSEQADIVILAAVRHRDGAPGPVAVGDVRSPRRARQPVRPARAQPDVPLLHPRRRPLPRRRARWRGPAPRSPSTTSSGPDFGAAAKAAGLPYLKGGICETGGTLLLFAEAGLYSRRSRTVGRRRSRS